MTRVSNLALALCLAISVLSPHAGAFSVSRSSHLGLSNHAIGATFLPPAARTKAVVVSTALRMSTEEASPAASKIERKPDSAVELTLTAPGPATKAAYDKVCLDVSKRITIPGFRKGAKIPPAVIENHLAKEGGRLALSQEAISALLGQLIEPAIKEEHKLDPIGQPSLVTPAEELAKEFTPGEPIELKVKVDVWPEIQWKDSEEEKPYYGLEGTYQRKPFDQEKFDRALNDLRDRYAQLTPMEEGATLAMGDACVVNMEGFMAKDDGETKGDPLPNAASGDNVEVILGKGRYMEGLVEGLVGAKVGDTKTVSVSFPTKLRDKTLAGKRAIFDVNVIQASHRTLPEVTDEFANKVRPGLTAESLEGELRKAIDEEDSKEYVDERNKALGKALSERMDVEVPDSLVTNQAREKYALMMTDMRDNGMADDEIKKLITPENFLKYKDVVKADIQRDFRISMAVDEIARLESIDVPGTHVAEQMEALKKEAQKNGEEEFDETAIRAKVETTLQRRLVFDFLNQQSNLTPEYVEEKFDADLMQQLADDSLKREEELAAKEETEQGESVDSIVAEAGATVDVVAEAASKPESEPEKPEEAATEQKPAVGEEDKKVEANAEASIQAPSEGDLDDRYKDMDLEDRAYNILADLGMVTVHPDPDDPDYNSDDDDEFCPEGVFV